MNARIRIIAVALPLCPSSWADGVPPKPLPIQAAQADSPASSAARMADKRYEEMLDRMQSAVEEIAQLYGNPTFLQVFTNDAGQASELKQRLKAARTGEDVRRELANLEKRREELLSDIALREREVARLSSRLVRQRSALEALAAAVEQARKAVEDTSK